MANFSLNRVKHQLPKTTMLQLYYTLIYPHLLYNITIWGNANQSDISKTITLQKKSIRIINKAKYNNHTEPLFKENKILKIQDLYEMQVMKFMLEYKASILPKSFQNIYPMVRDIHPQRSTRQDKMIYIRKAKLKYMEKLPMITFPVIYNKWIENLSRKNLTIKGQVKHITKIIIENYQQQIICQNTRCTQCNHN